MKRNIMTIAISIFFILFNLTPAFAATKDTTPSGIPISNIETKIDEYVNKYIGKTTPGAAIAVVKDGKIIFSKGYGYSDIENKIPVDPKETLFEYGSISKLFIWTSIMQLVEEGKLDLNNDIKTYLPKDFSSNLKYTKPITMLNLMNHTAGFEETPMGLIYKSPEDKLSLKESLLRHQPKQSYEPGIISSYSNYGAALAGYIVEQITGKSFSDYETENIFAPLNMEKAIANPTFDDNDKLKDIKAKAYRPNPKGGFDLGNWFYINIYPAGSVNGTVEDLAKFAMALTPETDKDTTLFKQRATLDKFIAPSYNIHKNLLSINHGFLEFNKETSSVGHGGSTEGFSTNFAITANERFGVIILTNGAGEMGLTYGLADFLLGKDDNKFSKPINSLPNSNEVNGLYIPTRTNSTNYFKAYSYLSLGKVKSMEENKIQFSNLGFSESYIQIEPYLYKLIETPNTPDIVKLLYSKLYFNVKDGQIESLSFGPINNYINLSQWKVTCLIFSITTLVIGAIYFLISPLVLLIQKLINKKKKITSSKENIKYKRLFVALNLSGTALLLNNALIITLITFDPFTSMLIQIIINWGILISSITLIFLLIKNFKLSDLSKKQKIFTVITIVVLTLFILSFINWKLFNLLI